MIVFFLTLTLSSLPLTMPVSQATTPLSTQTQIFHSGKDPCNELKYMN